MPSSALPTRGENTGHDFLAQCDQKVPSRLRLMDVYSNESYACRPSPHACMKSVFYSKSTI
eukprot:2289204-Amphidinium_carterae.1